MICYFDTSAFVPLIVDEPSSKACRELWDEADAVTTSRLLYVETAAALAQALRLGRMSTDAHQAALALLDGMWAQFEVVEANAQVIDNAGRLAHACALRGYDAVHCASAEVREDDDLVVVSGDQQLLAACRSIGMATANVNDLDG